MYVFICIVPMQYEYRRRSQLLLEATSTMNFFPLRFFSTPLQFFTHLQDSQIAVRGPPFAFQVSTRVQLPLGKQLLIIRTILRKYIAYAPRIHALVKKNQSNFSVFFPL